MRRILLSLTLMAGLLAVPAAPAAASWAGTNCYTSNSDDTVWKRADARAYALVARYEGYEWGGGCWNDNNKDDTPSAPDSGGEGPDCSGLVFKAWELENSYGTGGGQYWNKIQNIHGPYNSDAFHNVSATWSGPFFHIGKTNALYMDAFAKNGHVGLLWSTTKNSNGTYNFIEAKGDNYGVNIWGETWMFSSEYAGARRKGWTADCYPNCTAPGSETVTVE
jgi:hypothetical protein